MLASAWERFEDHTDSNVSSIATCGKEPIIAGKAFTGEVKVSLVGWPLNAFEVSAHCDDPIVLRWLMAAQQARDCRVTTICSDEKLRTQLAHTGKPLRHQRYAINASLKSADAKSL